jgi:hypothetical protein
VLVKRVPSQEPGTREPKDRFGHTTLADPRQPAERIRRQRGIQPPAVGRKCLETPADPLI